VKREPLQRDDYRVAPTVLGGWGAGRRKRTDSLTLNEIVLLRRIQGGETLAGAARSLGIPRPTVTGTVRKLRVHFGVETNEELLALPRVLEQLTEDRPA
jgi:hypothetical protein